MSSKSSRGIWLSLYKFESHIDWSQVLMRDIEVDVSRVGEMDSSGKKEVKNNCVCLRYTGSLPDRYDDRITSLVDAIGGDRQLQTIIQKHLAQEVFIMLEIPAKSSPCVEEGFISSDMMGFLFRQKIDLHFWYL